MLDRTIPHKNMIMRCDSFHNISCDIPEGILMRPYQCGNEKAWAELSYAAGDFQDKKEAEQYFVKTYVSDLEKLKQRCLFACTIDGTIVGSCIAWYDKKGEEEIASLHWLVVSEAFQDKGIGKALLFETMRLFLNDGEQPVYLHTQPWSYKAIHLYSNYGFRLMKKDSFSNYTNQYDEAVAILKNHVPKTLMTKLLFEAE